MLRIQRQRSWRGACCTWSSAACCTCWWPTSKQPRRHGEKKRGLPATKKKVIGELAFISVRDVAVLTDQQFCRLLQLSGAGADFAAFMAGLQDPPGASCG
jgi:hypothetical protein